MQTNESERSWKCPRCRESVDADFDLCWNCGATPDGTENPDFVSEAEFKPAITPDMLPHQRPIKTTLLIAGLLCILLWIATFIIIFFQNHLPSYFEFVLVFCSGAALWTSVGLAVATIVSLTERDQDDRPRQIEKFKPDLIKDKKLCPQCLTPNFPREHFCVNCATPLTSHAEIDPLGQVYAQGDIYRKAAGKPTRRIALLGMWLIFGSQIPFLIMALNGLIRELIDPYQYYDDFNILEHLTYSSERYGNLAVIAGILLVSLLLVVYSAILYKVTKNYLRHRRQAKAS